MDICSRASRTDKGVHALASALCLRITHEFSCQSKDLKQCFETLKEYLPRDISVIHVFDVSDPEFNARFACQKREYWYYVPYCYLLQPDEQHAMRKLQSDGMSSKDPLACQVWVSGLPERTSIEELKDLVRSLQKGEHCEPSPQSDQSARDRADAFVATDCSLQEV